MMTRSKPEAGLQQRQTLDLLVREIKPEERRVSVSFSSEQPYERWFGMEILQHEAESVDLSRLQNIGVALFNHNKDKVIGRIENARLDVTEKRAYCDIVFDDDEESEKVFKKVQSGTLKGVSVGYRVDEWTDVAAGKTSSNGRFVGPAMIASKWTPFEVSIVSVPADDSVGVGREMEEEKNFSIKVNSVIEEREIKMNLKERCQKLGLDYDALVAKGMSDEQIKSIVEGLEKRESTPPQTPPPAPATRPLEEEKRAAVVAEQERVLGINAVCSEFGIKSEERDGYIKGNLSLDQVNAKILGQLKALNKPVPASQRIEVGADEADKIRAAATDGLLLRAGVRVDKPDASANTFRGMSLRDMAIDCLVRAGVSNPHMMNPDELFKAALTPDSQLSSIATNAVNKSMAIAYAQYTPTCKAWCGVGSNRDFKATYHYQISEGGDLTQISQQAELPHDEPIDQYVSKQIVTRGKKFGFTRQALINDDLDVISKMPMIQVRAALRQMNKLAYTPLGNNGNITYVKNGTSTTKAIFHTDHSNIVTDGGVPASATVSAGRAAMRKQKNLKGTEYLNIAPKFLIVPPSLETAANQLVRSDADPNGTHAGVANEFRNALQVVVEAELEGLTSGANGWFLAADPMDVDTVEITYLNGQQSPILQSKMGDGIDYLGMMWSIIFDYGITCLDYRGLFYNDGVAST